MTEPELDASLAVRLTTGESGYIVGSCHTFPGRISVWIPDDKKSRCVSKGDLANLSKEAAYWVSGFLHGSVPSLHSDELDDEASWICARKVFLQTGIWRNDDQ